MGQAAILFDLFADFTDTWTALLPPQSVSGGENDVAVQDKESAEWMITIGPGLASK